MFVIRHYFLYYGITEEKYKGDSDIQPANAGGNENQPSTSGGQKAIRAREAEIHL